MIDPRAEYAQRLESRALIIAMQDRLHIRLGNAKLATLLAGAVLAWLSLSQNLFSPWWLLAVVLLYFALVVFHERAVRSRDSAQSSVVFYRQGLERIEDRWAGTGQSGERFLDARHPYTDDLDIFGRGCLFELLSSARMPMGENRLAQWLRSPSALADILERQTLVTMLGEKLDLREHLAIIGGELCAKLDPETLTTWAEADQVLPLGITRWLAIAVAIAVAIALGFLLASRNFLPLLVVLVPAAILRYKLREHARVVLDGVACNADGLVLFSLILKRLEQEDLSSPQLRRFGESLGGKHQHASHLVRRLARIVYWSDARKGFLGHMLDLPFLYTAQVAFAAESWRRHFGSRMRGWIDAAAEMEALLSVAAYSFEHPSDPFPEFDDASDSTSIFDGCDLGHPLIASSLCLRNSVRLDQSARILLVSGSNMSGKSTFLRTVGINTVLALAGAPIRGKSLRLTPFSLGTRIRSSDSLQEGRSNFFTEVLRIRQVFDLAKERPPALFLFDELLEGTNSADRRIGAEGILRGLLARGALGIVTTHDLALTEMGPTLGPVVHNSHFQDYVEEGQMRFDYTLREGVVTQGNAVELMRLIGLEV
jgi:hypothetical protein